MRHWLYTAALSGTAALTLGGLFAVDLFASKPNEPKNDDKPVPAKVEKAEKGEKGTDVALGSRSESASKLPVTKVMAPRPAEAGRVTAHGTFELDHNNRAFISLEFRDDTGATRASSGGRVAITIDGLFCDPAIQSVTRPPPVSSARSPEAVALLVRGFDLVDKGDVDGAIRTFSNAIDIDPHYVSAYILRGEKYRRKRNLVEALHDFNKAIELDNKNPHAFYNRGLIHTLLDDHVRAEKDYDAAIGLNPGDAAALNNRCWTRAVIGQLQDAMDDCNGALQLLQFAMKDRDEAPRLQPNFADALDSRGFTYLKLGQFEHAIVDYNAALTIVPRKADALYGRGLARLKRGDAAGGKADIAAAQGIRAGIAEEFLRRGVQ